MTDSDPAPSGRPSGRRSIAQSLVGAAIVIAIVTVVARAVGFARVFVFARTVGPSTCLGDAYFTANTVPNIVFEIVAGGALASLVVPVLAGPAERGARDDTARITSALLTWTVLLLTPLAVAGIWLAHPVMSLLVGDSGTCASDEVVATGTRMLLVFLPQIVLYGVGIVLAGTLQAHRRFTGPALAPLLSSVVVIAAYLVFANVFTGDPDRLTDASRSDELILSVGTTAGVAALSLGLLVPIRRLGLPLRPSLRFPVHIAPRVRALAFAGIATLVAQQLSVAVVLRLANSSGTGGAVTLYNLAWTVFLVPWAVLAVPIATSAFPRLSARSESGDEAAYAVATAGSSRAVILTTLAAAAVLVAAARPVANILALNAPNATADDVDALARALATFAPGLVGYGLVAHLGRALYARHEGKAAAVAISAGWLVVIVADLALVAAADRADTVPALGLGNTIGMVVAGALLIVGLIRRAGRDTVRGMGRAIMTGLLGALAATAVGRAVEHALTGATGSTGVATNLGVGAAAAVAALAVFALIAGSTNRDDMRALLQRKVAR